MAARIEITRISLTRLPDEEVRELGPGPVQELYLLEVDVRNDSNRTVHVVSGIRRVGYDAKRRLLRLAFAEAGTDPRGIVGLPSPISTTVVGGQEETTLTARLSSPLLLTEESEVGERRFVRVDIDDGVETIECSVAYSEEAPPASDLTALEPPERTVDWPTVTGSTSLH